MFDSNPGNTFGTLVAELAGFGLACLHVADEDGAPESGPRFDIGGLRNLWNGPYIVNGNYDYSRAMKTIADGRADFVSFGKLFLANPDLPLGFPRFDLREVRRTWMSIGQTPADPVNLRLQLSDALQLYVELTIYVVKAFFERTEHVTLPLVARTGDTCGTRLPARPTEPRRPCNPASPRLPRGPRFPRGPFAPR
jgi:NADH:flavin oxidoreductase / NADH oxidase family